MQVFANIINRST